MPRPGRAPGALLSAGNGGPAAAASRSAGLLLPVAAKVQARGGLWRTGGPTGAGGARGSMVKFRSSSSCSNVRRQLSWRI